MKIKYVKANVFNEAPGEFGHLARVINMNEKKLRQLINIIGEKKALLYAYYIFMQESLYNCIDNSKIWKRNEIERQLNIDAE